MLLSYIFIFLAVGLALMVSAALLLATAESSRRWRLAGRLQQHEETLFAARLQAAKRQLQRQENTAPWNGLRKFKIDRIVPECEGVSSFYLVPHDQKPLPNFQPGQYLTFELDIPGQKARVVRCYSLSDRPRSDYYRVTVKRIPPAPDNAHVGSNFFHTSLKAGDILSVKAPAGNFCLDVNRSTPVVLLGGGVGLTPLVSMLNDIAANQPGREAWCFLSFRGRLDHIMKEAIGAIAREHWNIRLRIIYSSPQEGDVSGRDFHFAGRLNLELLKRELPSNNFDFYLCGPGPMMSDLNQALLSWGVPEKAIHMEAFGPASVKQTAPVATAPAADWRVTFARSQREVGWNPRSDSLLELALGENVPMACGCRAGNCGTCKTAVKSGQVKYLKEPGCEVETGSCLPCICVPASNLVLEV